MLHVAAAVSMTTTVVRAATALAPALALWLASPEALTRAYAQDWQPAVADWLLSPLMALVGGSIVVLASIAAKRKPPTPK